MNTHGHLKSPLQRGGCLAALSLFAAVAMFGALDGCASPVEEALDTQGSAVIVNEAGDGYVTGCNAYDGNYNICTNNCQTAANCGVEAGNDGIISCDGFTSGPSGHAVNWDQVPSDAGGTSYCVSNPQSSPGTPACCFNQPGGGPISTTSGASCITQICGRPSKSTPPVAFDAGVLWDSGNNCAGTPTKTTCYQCCSTQVSTYMAMCQGMPRGPQRDTCVAQVKAYDGTCTLQCPY